MTKLELLQRTKTLLLEKGWIKKEMVNENGYCLIGALTYILGYEIHSQFVVVEKENEEKYKLFSETKAYLESFLSTETIIKYHSFIYYTVPVISLWNDEPERTKEEVFALLDLAIEKCK